MAHTLYVVLVQPKGKTPYAIGMFTIKSEAYAVCKDAGRYHPSTVIKYYSKRLFSFPTVGE